MAIEVGTAYLSILPSTNKLAGAIRRELDATERTTREHSKRLGGVFKKGFIGGAAGLGGAVLAFKGLTGSASDLGESVNAVNVAYGKNADAVKRLGRESDKALGLSNSDFNALAVSFESFTGAISGGGKKQVKVLQDLTTRSADFASVMNLDVNEATRLFQSGLAGESEPLRRYGIDLSAAAVQNYAYANSIAKRGERLTADQKVQAAYGLLMRETQKTEGDFANTSGEVANQGRILGASFENLKARLGEGLLPVLKTGFGFILDTALPAVESFIDEWQRGEGPAGRLRDAVERIAGAVKNSVGAMIRWRAVLLPIAGVVLTIAAAVKVYRGAMAAWAAVTGRAAAIKAAWLKVMTASRVAWLRSTAAAVGHRVATVASTAATKVHAAAMAAAAWGKQAILIAAAKVQMIAHKGVTLASAAATKVAAAGQWLLNAAMSANPIGLVVALLVGLVAAVVVAYKRSDTFRRVVDAAWSGIKRAVSSVWNNVLKPIFRAYVDYVQTMMRVVGWLWTRAVRPAFRGIKDVVQTVWNRGIKPAFSSFRDFILKTLPEAFKKGVAKVSDIWGSVQRLIAKPANFIIGTVYNDGIRKLFNALPLGRDLPRLPLVSFGSRSTSSEVMKSAGGRFLALASGGRVSGPGTETSDSIPAWLSKNEFVVRASVAKRHMGFLHALNSGNLPGYANGGRVWPLPGGVASTYPGHDGVDLNSPNDLGKPYLAAADGTVSYTGWGRGYGHAVFTRGPYGELVYGHSSKVMVSAGQRVKAGQVLGLVGNTGRSSGPHLHFGFPGGSYSGAMAFLSGARRQSAGVGAGGEAGFNPLSAIRIAKRIWDGVRGMASSGFDGLLKGGIRNALGGLKGWINRKVPGPGPIPGGVFDNGGILEPGAVAINKSNKPEAVFNHRQFKAYAEAQRAPSRVALTITNWETGEGYFREIADGVVRDDRAYAGTHRRMTR